MRLHEVTSPLTPTPEMVEAAKRFLMRKWRERAEERGGDVPSDLSGACKFASLFAARLFGGTVRGNFWHQWAEVGGRVIDLAEDAADVAALRAGEVPEYARSYAKLLALQPPSNLYAHDAKHMRSPDNRVSMASLEPRVSRWLVEFRAEQFPSKDDPR